MYTSNYFVYDILLIKVIKYMVNSHLSVRRILNKTYARLRGEMCYERPTEGIGRRALS